MADLASRPPCFFQVSGLSMSCCLSFFVSLSLSQSLFPHGPHYGVLFVMCAVIMKTLN